MAPIGYIGSIGTTPDLFTRYESMTASTPKASFTKATAKVQPIEGAPVASPNCFDPDAAQAELNEGAMLNAAKAAKAKPTIKTAAKPAATVTHQATIDRISDEGRDLVAEPQKRHADLPVSTAATPAATPAAVVAEVVVVDVAPADLAPAASVEIAPETPAPAAAPKMTKAEKAAQKAAEKAADKAGAEVVEAKAEEVAKPAKEKTTKEPRPKFLTSTAPKTWDAVRARICIKDVIAADDHIRVLLNDGWSTIAQSGDMQKVDSEVHCFWPAGTAEADFWNAALPDLAAKWQQIIRWV